MKKTERFVLLIDHESGTVRQVALNLAGQDGYVLIARTPESALSFAKQYKPAHAVIAQSRANLDGKFLPTLLLEFSPETEIVIVSEEDTQTSAVGQSA